MKRLSIVVGALALTSANAVADGISVEEGLRISIIGGCHDCHTDDYAVSGGQINPELALRGSAVGFQGPWGTTYPTNLRITLATMDENAFVEYGHTFKTRPPMPWFGVHGMTESELRSFYRYVKSLGEPGAPAPDYVEPGVKPNTPFIVFVPQMPSD